MLFALRKLWTRYTFESYTKWNISWSFFNEHSRNYIRFERNYFWEKVTRERNREKDKIELQNNLNHSRNFLVSIQSRRHFTGAQQLWIVSAAFVSKQKLD